MPAAVRIPGELQGAQGRAALASLCPRVSDVPIRSAATAKRFPIVFLFMCFLSVNNVILNLGLPKGAGFFLLLWKEGLGPGG